MVHLYDLLLLNPEQMVRVTHDFGTCLNIKAIFQV